MLIKQSQGRVTFERIKEIGSEGKNSKVFVIKDKQLNAELVLKEIEKSKLQKDAYFAEAEILYASSHTNVSPIQYCCEDDDFVYIVSPYHHKGSLKQLMSVKYLTVREIISYSTQILSGLHHIHSKGLIHFDVKPDNILLNGQGEAMVADFGLSRYMNRSGEAEPETLYSKHTPPEAGIKPLSLTARSDIFQMGLTMYRMCNGNEDFYQQLNSVVAWPPRGSNERGKFEFAVRNGRFPVRNSFLHHIPERLRAVIKKCLEIEPKNRYASCIEIVNDLADINGLELDWVYEVKNGNQTWTKTSGEREYRLEIGSDSSCKATKQTAKTEHNIRDYCLAKAKSSEVRKFLRTY